MSSYSVYKNDEIIRTFVDKVEALSFVYRFLFYSYGGVDMEIREVAE